MDGTCKICRHVCNQTIEDDVDLPESAREQNIEVVMECRRYPPTLIYDNGEDKYISMFPEVSPGEWCGEFKEKSE